MPKFSNRRTPLERIDDDARLPFGDARLPLDNDARRPQNGNRPAQPDDLQTSAVPNLSEIIFFVVYFLSLKSRCARIVMGADDQCEIHRSLAVRLKCEAKFSIINVWGQTSLCSLPNHTPDDVFVRLDKPIVSLIMYFTHQVVAAPKNHPACLRCDLAPRCVERACSPRALAPRRLEERARSPKNFAPRRSERPSSPRVRLVRFAAARAPQPNRTHDAHRLAHGPCMP